MLRTIPVTGAQPYDVVVGPGALAQLPQVIPATARQVFLIHCGSVAHLAKPVIEAVGQAGFEVTPLLVPEGESAKTSTIAAELWSALGRFEATRTDVIVGLGGGTVTDLAGFVAATWLRGVPLIQAPTTLLAMVDAAVGGKTGINTAEGKNLVGSFYPPVAVLADLDALPGLPTEDLRAGLAEVIKCGFIADPVILDLAERHTDELLTAGSETQRDAIERAIRVKASVVGEDLKEAWLREILNYGHTLGHAIELAENYTWRHGEAISVGMVFAAELANLDHRLTEVDVARHRAVLTRVGLPTHYRGAPFEDLLTGMRRDKKSRGDQLRFVVLDQIGKPGRLEGPEVSTLRQAFERICN